MTSFTPSVDTTIFPRTNLLKTFKARALQRSLNGRIYGEFSAADGGVSIDTLSRYPFAVGATCLSQETFPVDLGPSVTTATSGLIDLRNDCGSATTIDLNPLN